MKKNIYLLVLLMIGQFLTAESWESFIDWFGPSHKSNMKEIANMNTHTQLQQYIDGIEAWLTQQSPIIINLQNDLKKRPHDTVAIQEQLRNEKYQADAYRQQITFCKQMMALIKSGLHCKGRSTKEHVEILIKKAQDNLTKLDANREYVNNFMAKKDPYIPNKKDGFTDWLTNKSFSFLAGVDYQEITFRFKELKINAKNQRSILLYAILLNWAGTISNIGKPEYLKVLPDTGQLTGIAAKQALLMAAKKQFAEDPEYPLEKLMKAKAYVQSSLKLKK